MRNVRVLRQLEVNLTANDWQLYLIHRRDQVAADLNVKCQLAINEAENSEQALQECHVHLDQYSHYGADDTEGRAVVRELVSLRFPGFDEL